MTTTVSPVSRIVVRNPATGAPCGEVAEHSAADVAAAVQRARDVQPGWEALGYAGRSKLLRRLARTLARDEALIEAIVAETGKPRYEAEGMELLYTLELTRFFSGRAAREALEDEVRTPFLYRTKRARVTYHPRGVVGVIGPWNWPLLNNFGDAIAPLFAGNTVVLKPSRLTPLTSLRVEQLWHDAGLPQHVFQVVAGGSAQAEALIDGIDLVFFTGSEEVGRQVARRCADRVIPALLELGGKSPMVVLADADLERAAQAAVWSAFANGGQVCIRTERVFVERPAADRFIRLVADGVAALRQGVADGAAEIDIGPVRQLEHMTHLEEQIADALSRGARLVAGGARAPQVGPQFFAPTVLADCAPAMRVMREETFGPLLPIMIVNDAEHAVAAANDPQGGLSGSVWSGDAGRARSIARRLRTGSVCVNDVLMNYLCVESPLGGVPPSGLGFRHGTEALRQFCRAETIVEDTEILGRASRFVAGQLGFPYRPRVLRALRWMMQRMY